ncbi:DNA-directed RNA polymerase III RPC4 [Aspergillus bombycis]|uniref:DNA-directed RNA polymerase III RPC4 n=1 Tax=Aspergillus bombycis TaxID=109264 RepID=A0A1F7ZR14_9EURO|nr:DNA-directed RNA polymerase III RPC4 [Aspergillus bombycis]OGM41548.1 DNA-directed RNA polymerase III RPC4 [Aspergillus bombycis]
MPPKAAPRRGASAAAANRRTNASEPSSNSATPAPGENASTGPSASRPPVQRLQSLKKRTPSGSIGPAAKPPAPGGPGEPAKPTLKYKPRAVGRRSKEEREAIEKLEAERHRERLAEAAAIQRGRGNHGPGGRGGFGRGRGGQFGAASGPLGSMQGRRGRGGGPGGFGSRFNDSRASSMSRRSRSVIDIGSGAVSRDVSSDESDNEIRVSIDHINLDSDDEEAEQVVDKKKGKLAVKNAEASGERGLRPIRVERHEHEERVVSVNMESSSSKSAELRQQAQAKAADDGALFVPDDDGSSGSATETETGPRVKQEPTDDDHAMTDVAPHADEGLTTDDGLLPEQKVKVRRKISREPPAVKDPKSLLRTKEDIEEYERHEQDLAMVKDLFTKEEEPKEPQPEPVEVESSAEDTETAAADGAEKDKEKEKESEEEEDESAKDKLSGQLFLMQFPPMTPNLVPENSGDNSAAASIEAPGQGAPDGTASSNGIAPQKTGVKREDGVEILDEADDFQPTEPSKVVTATDWQLRAGRVGKLNVHASGRMTMDWGGISFELDRATAVDFLQEALIVSGAADPAEGGVPEEENRVWAMGQLSGKFTVMPDWEKML